MHSRAAPAWVSAAPVELSGESIHGCPIEAGGGGGGIDPGCFRKGGESSKVVHIFFSASSASLEHRHFVASSSAPWLRWRERICQRTLKTFIFSGLIEPIRLLQLLAARSGFLQGGRENSVYFVKCGINMTVWPFSGFTSPVSYLIPGVLNHSAGGSVDTLSHTPAVNIHLSTFRIFRKPPAPHPHPAVDLHLPLC